MLKGTDVFDILQGTPRPLGRCTRFILGEDHLAVQSALPCGEGMVCGIQSTEVNHMVAMYRCWDGHYIFYDNENNPPDPNFQAFCSRNGIARRFVKRLYVNIKGTRYVTCAYHAFTFIDFAVRCRGNNVFRIMT